MTQEELAERQGVGHQALSRMEQGKIAPKMERLPVLAESLKCSIPDLFRFEKPDNDSYSRRAGDLLRELPGMKQAFAFKLLLKIVCLLKNED